MSNSISFTGRLGRDAELKAVGDSNVLEFSLANDCGFGDRKVTNWFRCAVWGKQATSLEKYLIKGKQVTVHGELTLRTYTGKDGVDKISPDVRVNSLDLVGGKDDAAPAKSAPARHVDNDEEDAPF